MKYPLFFSINCRFWKAKDYKAFRDTKLPLVSIYERFKKNYDSSNSLKELELLSISTKTNDKLFYCGLESKANGICEHVIHDILDYVDLVWNKRQRDNPNFSYYRKVKIKMNDPNAKKGKRLLGILSILYLKDPDVVIWTLFPLLYENFHN